MGVVLARPIVLILHLLRLADAINFRKDYSPSLFRHLDPTGGGWPAVRSSARLPAARVGSKVVAGREQEDVRTFGH